MKRNRLAWLALALFSAGCTTAGPFVTSISSDGQGGLIIEKSMVKMNAFMGTVSNHDTTSARVQLIDRQLFEQIRASSSGNPSASLSR